MATDDDDPFGERDPAPGPGAGGSFGPCCVVVALVTALVGVLATFGGVPLAAHHGPRLPLAVQRAILDLLMGSHVQQLSAAQPDALKEVFFGGEPWIVQCSRTGVVSAAFVKAPTYLGNLTTFALLDCEEPLPSGKSTRERFKLGGAAGDQQSALFGQNCTSNGMAKNTFGTGCFMLMNIGDQPMRSKNQLLTSIACSVGDRREYALEGSVFIAGAAVQWLRDGLGIIQSSAEVESLAASVPSSDGVYLVPAFAGLGAPHWDSYARGTIVRITRGTTRAHLARAALEGIAFQVTDVLDAMKQDSGIPMQELRVDGGASANDLLMQFQADIMKVPVVRPKVIETTAMGAAYLAGLAVGYWKDVSEIATIWQTDKVFEPSMSDDEVESRRAWWVKALQRARDWDSDR